MASPADNPFAALLRGQQPAQSKHTSDAESVPGPCEVEEDDELLETRKIEENSMLERIFGFTLDAEHGGEKLLYIESAAESLNYPRLMDLANISIVLFERMLIPQSELMKHYKTGSDQSLVVFYLTSCYINCTTEKNKESSCKVEEIIVEQLSTILTQPDIIENQNTRTQLLKYFLTHLDNDINTQTIHRLYSESLSRIDDNQLVSEIVQPILQRIHKQLMSCLHNKLASSLGETTPRELVNGLMFFSNSALLAQILLDYNKSTYSAAGPLTSRHNGSLYDSTLFGCMLSSSCVRRKAMSLRHMMGGQSEDSEDLFSGLTRTSRAEVESRERTSHGNTLLIVEHVYEIFMALCRNKSTQIRDQLLDWFKSCLKDNQGRTGLSETSNLYHVTASLYVSDGFMINLCAVLLKMCAPFTQTNSKRILKIQPTFPRSQRAAISDVTSFIPLSDEDSALIKHPDEFNFITQLYYLTQLSLYIGFHAATQRLQMVGRELNRVEGTFRRIQSGETIQGHSNETITFLYQTLLSQYLSLKTVLLDPLVIGPAVKFHLASSTFLTQIGITMDVSEEFVELQFPLPTKINSTVLGSQPEYLLTNLSDTFTVCRRFSQNNVIEEHINEYKHLIDLMLVYMGSNERVKNPHLRAKLAEVLYLITPDPKSPKPSDSYIEEVIFTNHTNITQLSEVLFKVFVSIETTGESVEFNEKLSYRQPMYTIIEYIWSLYEHRQAVKKLSIMALSDISNPDPPLFLRFSNLFINDAIFLLDEAFDLMRQIKQKEVLLESSELSAEERHKEETELAFVQNQARFCNHAAKDTTHTISLLTSGCAQFFVHELLVERLANMLNYLLDQLSGPKTTEMKVKDFSKYDFEPAKIVSTVVDIYLNLENYTEFCSAVVSDGRSYSERLFNRVIGLLDRIDVSYRTREQFTKFSHKLQDEFSSKVEVEDNLVSQAPDEFIDPLMGILMRDPVMLPSSREILDKSVIWRHLLSDQIDPFNRAPLTVDQLIPQTELKQKIADWIKEQNSTNQNEDKNTT